ncbi:MAG: GH116 family glycosyl-hydrolase, partial [Porticoccaceae bacterium]|nr:GH116 family glycosyl-hydrolase [Porticoccaceae bacterium]
MALILPGDAATLENAQGTASWSSQNTLYQNFQKTGTLKGKTTTEASKAGATWTGALNAPFVLGAGEKKELQLVLAWYFPNGKNGGHVDKWDAWGKGDWEGNGNRYAHHWKNIEALTSYIKANHERLYTSTRNFTNTLYNTNLPHWLVERLGNQLSIIKSRTIFHDKDNYIGLWEGTGGVDGSCAGNCNHVWHYAQAHARLFPEMGRAIRDQTFDLIKENGQIPYRQPAGTPAFDGQCGDILGAYREHLLSED